MKQKNRPHDDDRFREPTPDGEDSSDSNLAEIRKRGEALARAADNVLGKSCSHRDSKEFVTANRQTGGE